MPSAPSAVCLSRRAHNDIETTNLELRSSVMDQRVDAELIPATTGQHECTLLRSRTCVMVASEFSGKAWAYGSEMDSDNSCSRCC